MTVRTVELQGARYVIIPEQEFLELQRALSDVKCQRTGGSDDRPRKFEPVVPIVVQGESASEMLIRERR